MTAKTVAPVVVNPETDSNTAQATDFVTPVARKGTVPAITIAIHPRPTTASASLGERSTFLGVSSQNDSPVSPGTRNEISQGSQRPSRTPSSAAGTMAIATAMSRPPRTWRISRCLTGRSL